MRGRAAQQAPRPLRRETRALALQTAPPGRRVGGRVGERGGRGDQWEGGRELSKGAVVVARGGVSAGEMEGHYSQQASDNGTSGARLESSVRCRRGVPTAPGPRDSGCCSLASVSPTDAV